MDQLTLTREERYLLDVTEAPLAPARQLELSDFLRDEVRREPARSRRRLFGFLAAILATLTLSGGVAAYAWVARSGTPSNTGKVYCYIDTSNVQREGRWQGGEITALAPIEGGTAPAISAVQGCAELWSMGTIHRPGVTPAKESGNPVPELTACIEESGAAVVFPADAAICTRLGLPSVE